MVDPFPDRDMALIDKLRWVIEEHGWAAHPVAPDVSVDPPRPAYTYSIGFEARFGLPDVAIFGLTGAACRGLLDLVAAHVGAGGELPVGAPFTGLLDGEQRCALLPIDLDVHGDWFDAAALFYGATPFRVLQMCWPDRQGWLPFEPGFEDRLRLAQPVLGTLTE